VRPSKPADVRIAQSLDDVRDDVQLSCRQLFPLCAPHASIRSSSCVASEASRLAIERQLSSGDAKPDADSNVPENSTSFP
jgi:hypothetical protein